MQVSSSEVARGKYGYFDSANREYVITRPDTPLPWFNYLMNDSYVALISNTGGGVSYDTDPRVYRLLRYRYMNVPADRPGRYVYIRDRETGRYWSATWAPVHQPLGGCRYTCRMGTGYMVVTMEYIGIRTVLRYFVPRDGRQEIWDLAVTNLSRKTRELSTFSYAEFAFWGARRDLMNLDSPPSLSLQHFDSPLGAVVHHSYNDVGSGLDDMRFVQNYGFHTASPRCSSFSGNREQFIGRYRDERNPAAVEQGASTRHCKTTGQPVGSLEHRFTLGPGASKRIVYRTGMSPSARGWRREAGRYASPAKVDRAFEALRTHWQKRLDAFSVKSPDKSFDAMLNGFVQYQAAVTMRLSRSISPYERGISRSIGFRDSCQDQLGLTHAFPETARTMLGHLMSAVRADGQACHDFNPVTREWGSAGFYDDHNWLALTVNHYIRETGDWPFLDEKFPFALSGTSGTAWEHLLRTQDFAWRRRGRHGLMQTGAADWNDCLNPGDRRTESVFTSMLYCAATRALTDLAGRRRDMRLVNRLERRFQSVRRVLNNIGWDGAWYRRLIKTSGQVLGTSAAKQGARIFLEPQPWSVMAGVAIRARAVKALDSVERRLGTPFGHRLLDRPFTKLDMAGVGAITLVPPGIKENGSVFNHASAWMILAEAMLGRGDRAYRYFMRKAGTTKNRHADRLEVEPYVACQYISAPPFHTVGRGRNAWLTGSAAWIAVGAMQGILGCRPEFDGLGINPSIPARWPGFSLVRKYRGTTYTITVRNPGRVQHGVAKLVVDGQEIPGTVIPHSPGKKNVDVQVVMGRIPRKLG